MASSAIECYCDNGSKIYSCIAYSAKKLVYNFDVDD